ncbi:competence protein ComEC [Hansschlegelia plantiphila]|uniref:Competence protein ComEC n=1 Tax=Hansschlegelia plantiphila TaxID=374655 RepID=A0A9W6MWZ3_9HYPH|nr:competence protein ComEC [Hansschlegelia plantiphila]
MPDDARVADGGAGSWTALVFGWLSARLAEEAEAGRFALWLPVAFGVGVATYFAASREPALWAATALAIGAGALSLLARRRFIVAWLALALLFGAAGFLSGKLATIRMGSPALAAPLRAEAVGRVVTIEPRARGWRRVTIDLERLGSLPVERRPAKARITIGFKPPITVGDRISLAAYWRPPEGPVRPGGYDFARVAFFQGVGATGLGASDIKAHGPDVDMGLRASMSAALERLRASLTERITTAIGGPEGAVAAALVTGVQGPIPQDVQDDLRGAGLSHILSISGLHMALVAGTMFWLARALLALSSRAALNWPVKQIAAAVALAGATFYLALSGAEVATQRSYVMIAIAFLAVMINRPALAPRNFALAALIVLALTPEAMLGPSFQMSFAAVAGLVAWFETRRDREPAPPPPNAVARVRRKIATAVTLALMTTLVAGLATAPFAAYHFHRVTPYAIAGNALAEPIMALVVMPSVLGGLLFAPLGLDGIFWRAMGGGLRAVLAISHTVASWPGSERNVTAFGETSLALFALGIAWLCLWRTKLRWAALPALAAALGLAAWPSRPDVVIDPSGRFAAVRSPTGELALLGAGQPGGSFAAKVWFAADAAEPPVKGALSDVRCDAYGCTAPLIGGGIVALSWDARALEEDCKRAVLVVTRLDPPEACSETTAVVGRRALAATGALSLSRDGPSFSATAARDPGGLRPWTGPPNAIAPPEQALRLTFSPRLRQASADAQQPVDPTDPDDEPGVEDQ